MKMDDIDIKNLCDRQSEITENKVCNDQTNELQKVRKVYQPYLLFLNSENLQNQSCKIQTEEEKTISLHRVKYATFSPPNPHSLN